MDGRRDRFDKAFSSSSSIGSATLVSFGLLNYRWVFSAVRFLQSAVSSGTSNPPTWRTSDLERSNSRHKEPQRLKRRKRTPVAEGGTMGEKLPRILPKVATSTSLLGSFTCRKFTTWDRRLYFPSEGRRAEDFLARKIRRPRPGLNTRTWVPKASTLTSRPPKLIVAFRNFANAPKNTIALCQSLGLRVQCPSHRVSAHGNCIIHIAHIRGHIQWHLPFSQTR